MGSDTPPQTVLQILDSICAKEPGRLYCIHPFSSDISQGWVEVRFADVVNATNRMALWIQENVASSNKPEALTYIGANDIRYCIFAFACMRLRHKAVFLSTRNSAQASRHVLEAVGCSKCVYTPERSRQVEDIKELDSSVESWLAPDMWTVFDHQSAALPMIEEPPNDPEDRVAVYIHSSGTTGMPKPVPMTNGYFMAVQQMCDLPTPENRIGSLAPVAERGKRILTSSPLFHLMGLFSALIPIYCDTPIVMVPEKPLTLELFARIVQETEPKTANLPPPVLEELSSSELGMACLKKFDMLTFGGAPLSQEAGDRIAKEVHLQSILGSSECAVFSTLKYQEKDEWRYLEWNPYAGYEMRDMGDGYHEFVIPRGESRAAHAVFHTYPDLKEYRTGDLFTQHPTKNGLWLYAGRYDDVIVLSNGEKFNPITMEEIISSHPLVARAVTIGQGRFQAAILVEPDWDEWNGEPSELLDEIWPTVKKANAAAPSHAQVTKERVGISSRSKPFQLTPKGTIKRRMIANDYASEIDALYAADEQMDVAQIAKEATLSEIAVYVMRTLSDILEVPAIDQNADIFAMGLDSLQTLRLGKVLQASLQSVRPDLGPAFSSQQLYSLPTITRLAEYILNIIQGGDSSLGSTTTESDIDREQRISNLVNKYSADFGSNHAVILTGSTGSLGAYLLSELLRDLSVTKIYCLNRSSDAAIRQLQSHQEKGLATYTQFPRRVEFLQAQFGAERLGLDEAKYEELLLEVDTIIHNAWKVNFNHKVEAFENPHIEGVRRLVEFSIASEKTAHIHFISSISTIEGYSNGPSIPESIFNEPSSVLRQGYGESKHVAERICAMASAKCGVPTSIHRVGQIGGPTTEKGIWNKQEWVPSLIAASKTIKQIPNSLGSIAVQWVPVDICAKVILDIVRTRRTTQDEEPCAAFHIVNPKIVDWETLIPFIQKYMDVEPVPLQTWINTLESFPNPTEADLRDKPALKILEFFKAVAYSDEAGPSTETIKTQAASTTLRHLNAVDGPLMTRWMDQWKF
ncbi:NRPS-like protein biosynthetic cluster [Penicillium macrosclerotiorum]|uniref:NRPS-like protein biosynthetic cluster n=1 Tax=Penicillium macrosclerotiorum TaxID=303699 RepID=UPI002547CA66|nr:NRPS-like protein biosynthetic cluster [Penicillium macrosclerotiorum]KAJ5668943.1 NRPS-like protein biosynthetic cluster [Penicillium macrosclerotiorum]